MSTSPVDLTVLEACPALLREQLAAGRQVLLTARFSSPSGAQAYRSAAKNVRSAAGSQLGMRVLDLTRLIPSEAELADRLRTSDDVVRSTDENGRPFTNRYLTWERGPLVIHLSAGSGAKIDQHTWHQPAVHRLAQEVRRVSPALVIAAEASRWGRQDWLLAPWVHAMRTLQESGRPVFLAQDGQAVSVFDQATEMQLFFAGQKAAGESRSMRARTTAVHLAEPVRHVQDGRAAYPFHQPPPPGWAAAWLRSPDRGGRGVRVMFLDSPDCRPAREEVNYGLPEVVRPGPDGDPVPVNQLALVRWYLEQRWGQGRSPRTCAEHLLAAGFSTAGLRQTRGDPSAEFDRIPPPRPPGSSPRGGSWPGASAIKAIERQREVYLRGRLILRIPDREETVTYLDMWPPDGRGYLSPEAAENWERALSAGRQQYERARRYTFGHHPVSVNGHPARLVGAETPDGAIHFNLRRSPPLASPFTARRLVPRLPHDALARSLLQALVQHHASLQLVEGLPHRALEDETAAALAEARLAHQRAVQDEERDARYLDRLGRASTVADPALDRARDRYNDAHHATRHAARIVERLEDQHARAAAHASAAGLAVVNLLEHLARLRDPHDLHDAPAWREALTDLAFTTTRVTVHGLPLDSLRWTGQLRLIQDREVRMVPITGEHLRLAKPQQAAWLTDLVAGMRAGIPLGTRSPGARNLLARLRLVLGLPDHTPLPLGTVQDPRILRIGMAVCHPPLPAGATRGTDVEGLPLLAGAPLTRRQLAAAARRLGEPLALVKRVHALDTPPGAGQRRWRLAGDVAVAELFATANTHDGIVTPHDVAPGRWGAVRHAARYCPQHAAWDVTARRLELRPCPHCDSRRRTVLLIREAPEPVCLDCRRDTTGIDWPETDYDLWNLLRP